MPVDIPKIAQRLESLFYWRSTPRNGDGNGAAHHNGHTVDEQPLRAELYSLDQLERHAHQLAEQHTLARDRAPDRLLPRLEDNHRVLLATYDLVTHAVKHDRRIAPASEWLLDNFYLVGEQIRLARRHLPRAYSRQLPRLANGSAAGYPRVYAIALELIAHVDGRIDAASLNAFISAYQSVHPLGLGELWAVPIMLRLALIENLRRVAARIAAGRRDRDIADDWAEKMVRIVEKNPTDLILVLADMARANPPLTSAFIAEFTRHLHGQSPYFAFAHNWLEHRLSEQGRTLEQLVQMESQAQAADQVSIGNSITSLRFLIATDWRDFVESQSIVEQTLKSDPPDVYAQMDFATRDRYRHALEEMARRGQLSEHEVARRAIRLAAAASVDQPDHRSAHVGYYLIDKGCNALERMADVRLSPARVLATIGRRFPLGFYLLGIAILTAMPIAGVIGWAMHRHAGPLQMALLAIPLLLCALHLGIALVNWLVTLVVSPRPLPRMNYRQGVPPEQRTMVVVPTMLSTVDGVTDLLDGLEVRYLANRDDNIYFALLTDFRDAPQKDMPGDEELVKAARAGVEALNTKYSAQRPDIFFLFHRPRLWNAAQNCWMGYERKRGKLAEFNALLRGGSTQRFSAIVGNTSILPDIRNVITLDTDTQLPRDTARQMVAAIAHPLNRPVFDAKRGRVIEGYSILQPRVGVSLPSASRSWFVRLFAGEPGVDPYTKVVSDVYHDVFGEGSFIGKGIYDVNAFEQACGKFPENAILSHDLLESAHARSGLLSDVELFEEHPSRYPVDVGRRHRWIRGDWQIAWWLLPRVPGAEGRSIPNPISALSWWKIFDNLRRSVVPLAMLALLLIGWFSAVPGMVTLFVLSVILLVPILSALLSLAAKPIDLPLSLHIAVVAGSLWRQLLQGLAWLCFLPYDAYMSADAVARTLVRMLWTRRRLLEWKSFSEAERGARADLGAFFITMLIAPVIGIITLAVCLWLRPGIVLAVAPFAVAWMVAPALAWLLSRPLPPRVPRLTAGHRAFLEKLSRSTWRFFEVFVNEQENYLPPDNFQEHPAPVIASRTSPTNIGMALLANLSAYDFGYITAGDVVTRCRNTLGTLKKLERYRDHFFNWYDTRTLAPLPPRYVSTVDSGNLAGHLIVLQHGLIELIDAPILPSRMFQGLRDTLRILLEAARGTQRRDAAKPARPLLAGELLRRLERMEAELEQAPRALAPALAFLNRMNAAAAEILPQANTSNQEVNWWLQAFASQCAAFNADLNLLGGWVALIPASHEPASKAKSPRLHELHEQLRRPQDGPTLHEVSEFAASVLPAIDAIRAETLDDASLVSLREAMARAASAASQRVADLYAAAADSEAFAQMDFTFLFDKTRELLSIGYNVSDHRLDASFYDLLASEARLTSYVAIAQGQLGQEHWFALSRLLTSASRYPALLSWSGSMFEYLMPMLVMPTFESTLLDQTCKAVVRRQIDYGRQRGVPWGISESGYNATDVNLNYQYRAFGVPGLGLKRGLGEDLVVAPYASVMALMVAPEAACKNLERLESEGFSGRYGMYEAIDYTPSRLPSGTTSVTIRSFMAHHEGMSLLSLAYLLLDRPMQRRFNADPMLRATELLLQERVPKSAAKVYPHAGEAGATRSASAEEEGTMRVFTDPSSGAPEVHLLSNGRYQVMVSSAGGGYSRWGDLAVTRWREDPTRDAWGSFVYLRDIESDEFWSAAFQPALKAGKPYEAIFTQARAEFRRRDEQIESHTEICVSPEDDVELRRITLTNRSDRARSIEVTTYAEVVLAPANQDLAHPAFSNLFVQTELVRNRQAIFCTRRPRSAGEKPPWMMHLMHVEGGEPVGKPSFETDRMKFLGRGMSIAEPAALAAGVRDLSDSHGAVLDPVVCIRMTVHLKPDEVVRIGIATGVAETREGVEMMVEKYHDPRLTERAFELAWTHSHVMLRQLNATETDAQLYGRLAGAVLYTTSARRAPAAILARNRRGQSGLWGYGISGDLPIVLVGIRDQTRLDLISQAVQAHAYWRLKGLSVDLVIWNEDDSLYRQSLHDTIMGIIAASPEAALVDKPGGIFVRRGEHMSEEDRVLLQSVARVVLNDDAGTLAEQIERRGRVEASPPPFRAVRRKPDPPIATELPRTDLLFHNGIGGFTRDGKEYVARLLPGVNTPAPWSNVLANPDFGTVVSESGSIYTWSENSHEFRLTPWYNDPVSGMSGEAIYLRDEENGRSWSVTPWPKRGPMPYITRHGFGYSVFEYADDGIATELFIYVSINAPVKFARLKISNRSGRARRVSATAYWEWVLGELRHKSLMHVVSDLDTTTGAIFARNPYNAEFGGRIVFVDCSETTRTITADRTEFLGRNGSPANPAALRRTRLSGRVGPGLDPCAAMLVPVNLDDGQEKEIVFTLGSAHGEDAARQLVQRFRGVASARRALEEVWGYWGHTLGAIHVETPDPAVNFMANGWLLYQVLACRMWARTGFYQSGGAFGFRDQLQDAMALLHAQPALLRQHLLLAAAHQFRHGDVQHWWHPPVGRGVRTHFSDDYLWLTCAACRYVSGTGDTGVLDEKIPFIDGRPVRPEEEAYYDLPQVSEDVGSLYDHCVRAIENGLRYGVHGLPLMGCGDWNDGMNLVGEHGKGESVWLGFFLYDVLTRFAPIARQRGDHVFADKCLSEAGDLRRRIEESAWDGEWYRRAYFDDGSPLGSSSNEECQIDSLPQSWSVLSGAGERSRAQSGMESVDRRLVRRDAGLIQLFDPPFDKSALNPGYIKGYVPGVRENGGQYTHAAVWTVMAFAALGDSKRAWELFNLINPVSHGSTPDDIARYKVEPYVVAADVYAVPPHTGRGGWTWYTGSAGWLYRLMTESLLGLELDVDRLRFNPCLPTDWKQYTIHYRYRETFYRITIHNAPPGAFVQRVIADGGDRSDKMVQLIDDRNQHYVDVWIG